MNFGALSPEINSARMYTGPGPGPMLAAAAAWDGLAAELGSTASSYQSVITGLTSGVWQGPTSGSMAAAAAPYVAWMSATAAQAEQTAGQARAAAAAYEAAFAATVPPPVIAANRSLLMALIATNFLGQNTAAIAATEFHYAEMWAQDAAAMYGYAGASATASRVTPFTAPPQTTNAGGPAGQAAAVAQATATSAGANTQTTLSQLVAAVPQALQNLALPASSAASDPPASPLSNFLDFIAGPTSPLSYYPIFGVPYLLGFQGYLLPTAAENYANVAAKVAAAPAASAPLLEAVAGSGTHTLGGAGPAVSAGVGNAGAVGKLSVPQSWAAAAPAIRPVAAVLAGTNIGAAPAVMADGSGNLVSQMALSGLAGRGIAGTGGTVGRSAGVLGGGAAGEATSATIIVIPAIDE